MAGRLILDTGVIVRMERLVAPAGARSRPMTTWLSWRSTLAELRAGAELGAPERRDARAASIRRLLEVVPVVPYDAGVADVHGTLLAHVHRTGRRPGAHDLIVAATAAATGRLLLTTDRRARFDDLPGVDCLATD